MPDFSTTPQQLAAVNSVVSALEAERRALLMACVASGHTRLIHLLVNEWEQKGLKRVVVVVKREKVATRLAKLKRYMPSDKLGMDFKTLVSVVSYDKVDESLKVAEAIVLEDCHVITEEQALKISTCRLYVVGITLTSQRAVSNHLDCIFKGVNHSINLSELIEEGRVARIVGSVQVVKKSGELDIIVGDEGLEYNPEDVAKYVKDPDRDKVIVDACLRHTSELMTVIFAANEEHVVNLTYHLRDVGLRAAGLRMSRKTEMRKYVDAFTRGDITHLVVDDYLLDRLEEPGIDAVVIAHPVHSIVKLQKYVGMGLRVMCVGQGKQCKVLEIRDRLQNLATLPKLFELPTRYYVRDTDLYTESLMVRDVFRCNPLSIKLEGDIITSGSLFKALCNGDLLSLITRVKVEEYGGVKWLEWDSYNLYALYDSSLVEVCKNEVGGYNVIFDNREIWHMQGGSSKGDLLTRIASKLRDKLKCASEGFNDTAAGAASEKQIGYIERYINKSLPDRQIGKVTASEYIYKIELLNKVNSKRFRLSAGKYYGFPVPYVYYFRLDYLLRYKSINPLIKYMDENKCAIVDWIVEYKPLVWKELEKYGYAELKKGLSTGVSTSVNTLMKGLSDDFEFRALLQRRG